MNVDKKPSFLTNEIFNALNILYPEPKQVELIEKLINEHTIESLIENDQQLSRRERSCLFYTALGQTAKEIADILGIEKCTVDEYKKNIIKKLNCNNMNHCIYRAVKRKILGINHFSKKSITDDLSKILRSTQANDQTIDKPRVLFVEDNEIAQKIGQSHLESHHCDIHLADSVQETILRSNERKYDFILLDIGLPDGTGLEAARYVRDHSSYNKTTPIIAITAHFTGENSQQACLDAGINQVYIKPLKIEYIKTILDNFVSQKQATSLIFNKDNPQDTITYPQHHPAINLKETAERLNISTSQIETIFAKFTKELPAIREIIEGHLTHRRWAPLQKEIHKLRRGSSYAGATHLEKLCADLESFLTKQTESVQELCSEIITTLELLIENYYSPKN